MRWAGHVAHMGGREMNTGGNMRERDHLGDQGIDRKIILKWILKK
jgi:hypothetical protein